MTKGLNPGHVKCDGIQMEWVTSALIMEMEVCPVRLWDTFCQCPT